MRANDDRSLPVLIPSKITRRFVNQIVLILLSLLCTAAAKEKPPDAPPATFTTPTAATPGKTTRITFHGVISGQPLGVWTSFPSEVTPADSDKKNISFDFKIPPEIPVGIHAVRLATTAGLSNLQLFMVDDLPTTNRTGKNLTPSQAQLLTLPVAIDGVTENLASDYYQFDASPGQTISFEVVAQRLNSRLDPIVRILDATGRELAYCDDTPGLGGDSRFSYTFTAAGRYLIELRDADYQGGSDFRYHLRVGHFPTATVPFPLGGKRGSETDFAFAAPALSSTGGTLFKTLSVKLSETLPRQNLALKFKDDDSSGFVSLLTAAAPDFVAHEPNLTPKSAARIPLPANISGCFANLGEQHFYGLAVKKGDRVAIRAQTRAVNSPCDLLLQFFKPDNTKLAESKPAAADEGALDITIPADGQYRLSAQDIGRGAGPACVYRLEVERLTPGFTLSVETDKFDAAPGATIHIKVKSIRQNFDSPIILSLTGDAATLELKNQTIPAGKNETDLEVKLPPDPPAHLPLAFTIVGAAKVTGVDHTAIASTAAILKSLFPRLASLPTELDGQLAISIHAATK